MDKIRSLYEAIHIDLARGDIKTAASRERQMFEEIEKLNNRLTALKKFTGDIIVYADKSISMYSTVDKQPDSYGKEWDEALDRLHKRQQRKTDD